MSRRMIRDWNADSVKPDGSTRMSRRVQLREYEFDFEARELRKDGRRVKLQEQPLRILATLLERPGDVVTREALKEELWPDDTTVDFDNGLGSTVGKLRAAFGDSAKEPRYIETIPRRGFRLIAPVKELPDADMPRASPNRRWSVPATIVGALVIGLASSLVLSGSDPADLRPMVSVAVLPFDDISDGVEEAYFADGMTDAFIHTLAQIPTLHVTSRTSVLRYQDTRKPLPQIAEELGVETILEGTVQRSDGRVQVAMQLIDARRDRHIWSETFTGEMSDVLGLQNDAARALARRMHATLSPELDARLREPASVNPQAHEAYLKGSYFLNQRTKHGYTLAIRHFDEAIRIEPELALAYAGLAQAYGRLRYQKSTDRTLLQKSKSAAMAAIAIDPNLAQAHAALGYALEHEHEWAIAERAFRRAIELAPSSAETRGLFADFLMKTARWEEALRHARTAKTLDPVSLPRIVNLGMALGHLGLFDESVPMFHETLELYPNLYLAHLAYGISTLGLGDVGQAIPSLETAARLSGGQPHTLVWLAKAYASAGREDDVREIYRTLIESARRGDDVSAVIAIVAKELGKSDEAYEYLEQAYAEGDALISQFNLYLYESFRGESRFEDLKRRIGLQSSLLRHRHHRVAFLPVREPRRAAEAFGVVRSQCDRLVVRPVLDVREPATYRSFRVAGRFGPMPLG